MAKALILALLLVAPFWGHHAPVRPAAKVPVKVANLHRQALVFDAHVDTAMRIMEGAGICERTEKGHFDLARASEGGLDAQFFSVFSYPNVKQPAATTGMGIIAGIRKAVGACPDRVGLALSSRDIERLQAEGKLAVLIGLEGGHYIDDDLAILRKFHQSGARYMSLTWSKTNSLADSSEDAKRWGGLSRFGEQVILEMNRLGMLIDVSHASDETFYEILQLTTKPVIASHSSCRALQPVPRNLTDDMLRAVANNGGVVCVNFYPKFLGTRRVGLQTLVNHIEHAVTVAGVDHVGLGSDFDGIDAVPMGMEDVSRLPALTEQLLRRGFREEDVRKILGENLMRVVRQVIG